MSAMAVENKISGIQAIREMAKCDGRKLPEIIGSHSINCDQNLFIMYLDKCKHFTWKFNIKPNSNKHVLLRRAYLLEDHLPEYSLDCITINSLSSKQQPASQMWENQHITNLISFQLVVMFYSDNYGTFEQRLVFEFDNGDKVVRHLGIQVSVEAKIMSALYFQPVKDAENELAWIKKYHIVPFDGEPQISFKALKNRLPPNIEDLVCFGAFNNIDKKLTKENYKERLHLLLHIEEYQRRKKIHDLSLAIDDIRKYVHKPIPGIHQNAILKLPSDELQTEQACQLIGKSGKALMKVTNQTTQDHHVFELLLEQILSNEFVLEMSAKLVDFLYDCKDPLKADLCFRFVDVFQYMHQAIDNVFLSDVFPRHPLASQSTWSTFRHQNLSKDQSIALNEMMKPGPGPPVLVLGPFGSGKTRTLATGIMDLLTEMETRNVNHRILICTHSNSAADHYIEDFIDPFLQTAKTKKNVLIRVNWELRYTASVSRTVLNYCEVKNGKFVQPTKEEIEKYKVVVCTLVTADILYQTKISRDHFTHIFIDEAAQAMEVEAIIPLVLKGDRTKVILAGDHLQLGPYLSSPTAKHLGLGISLLERLFQEYPYDSPFKLKLLENYRSFAEIVEMSSALFYEGALLSNKARPPGVGYPLRFFGIHGKESVSNYHPSYFNLAEANEVLCRIKELENEWPKQLGTLEATKICVLCCFSAQIQEIRLLLRRNGLSGVRVENVNNVQGLEFDVVILSTVRSYATLSMRSNLEQTDLGFLSNPKLLNTAITRAKYLCIFVGEPVALCSFGACRACWKTVLASCQKHGEFHYRLAFDNVMEISDKLRETVHPDDDVRERTESLEAVFKTELRFGADGSPGRDAGLLKRTQNTDGSHSAQKQLQHVQMHPLPASAEISTNLYGMRNVASVESKLAASIATAEESRVSSCGPNACWNDIGTCIASSMNNTTAIDAAKTAPIAVVIPLPVASTHRSDAQFPVASNMLYPAPFMQYGQQFGFQPKNGAQKAADKWPPAPMPPNYHSPRPIYRQPIASWSTSPMCNIDAPRTQAVQVSSISQCSTARVEYETCKFFVNKCTQYIASTLFPNSFILQKIFMALEQINVESHKFVTILEQFPPFFRAERFLGYTAQYVNMMRSFDAALIDMLPEPPHGQTLPAKQQYDVVHDTLLGLKLSLEYQFHQRNNIIITRHNIAECNNASMLLDKLFGLVLFLQDQLVNYIRPNITSHIKYVLMGSIKLKFISSLVDSIQHETTQLQALIEKAKVKQFENIDSSSSSTSSEIQERIDQFLPASDNEAKLSLSSDSAGSFEARWNNSEASRFEESSHGPHCSFQSNSYVHSNVMPNAVKNNMRGFCKPRFPEDAEDIEAEDDAMRSTVSNLLSLTDEEGTGHLDDEVEDITSLIQNLRSSDLDVDEWFVDRASDLFVKEYIASYERHLAARLPSPSAANTERPSWVVKYRMTPRYKQYTQACSDQCGYPYQEGVIYFEKSTSLERPMGVIIHNQRQIYFPGLDAINRSLIGDKVRFELTDSHSQFLKGRVVRVLERGRWSVKCKVSLIDHNLMIPYDEKGPPIIVGNTPKDTAENDRSIVRTSVRKFIVKVMGWPHDMMYPVGVIEEEVDIST